ncbi:MAG TPA: hypothetical protein GXX33_03620 [Firmicutes bacterium]|uniref:Basal-body rod modification protein FlgD n=1 Tax=Capillibacterium thermochitinicola TaxID=2699427 RepID=A0A8J6LT73_9FIRM|nr:flagellar hook capping FlgD N-terminal domain-containing protein [Capillibacterium thermochitinicola]MBA2134057.1 hypothetical protein [Capillibacterium thermochitinicola]HHW12072.1 hypothetical protein [Bacillota bacterium]
MITPVGSSYTSSTVIKSANDFLGKDAFLNLLVMELRYQDPLDPMKDRDFIAQMAQFSALEQMQNLYRVSELQQATAMLGRSVIAQEFHEGGLSEMVYGQVTGVRSYGGQTYLMLDSGREIRSDQVVSVMDEKGLEQYLHGLVGRKAFIRVYNEIGEVVDFKEVLITGYRLKDGGPYIVYHNGEGEEEVPLADVWGVV